MKMREGNKGRKNKVRLGKKWKVNQGSLINYDGLITTNLGPERRYNREDAISFM